MAEQGSKRLQSRNGPEVPSNIISFKLDRDSGHAFLEQETLRGALKALTEYVLELHTHTMSEIKTELDTSVEMLKGEMKVSIGEAVLECEHALKRRIEQAEEMGEKAMEKATGAETAAKKAVDKTEGLDMAALAAAKSSSPTPGEQSSGGAGTQGAAGVGAPPPGWDEMKSALEDAKFELKGIQIDIENKHFVHQRKIERMDSRQDEEAERVNELENARQQLDERTQDLRVKENDMRQELERLERDKANSADLAVIPGELERLRRAAQRFDQELRCDVVPRVEKVEAGVKSLEAYRVKMRETADFTNKNVEVMRGTIANCVSQVESSAQMSKELNDSINERHDILNNRWDALTDRISVLAEQTDTISTKADQSEVHMIKEALGLLARHDKEREQAVLFGARCLSCNRVFDEVDKQPNTVDLNAERQKAQLFNQVQKALNNPASDFSKPIKLISVKVGRQAQGTGNNGQGKFATRDGAFGYAMDDVQLLMRGWKDSGDAQKRPSSMAEGGVAPPAGPPSGRPHTSSSDNRVLPRPSPTGGRMMTTVPTGLPNKIVREGPMDYKKPLSDLLGQPREQSTATDRNTVSKHRSNSSIDCPDSPAMQPWSAKSPPAEWFPRAQS